MTRLDGDIELFEAHRPRLVRLAYRMLGSMLETKDVVQDAWLRWCRWNARPSCYTTFSTCRWARSPRPSTHGDIDGLRDLLAQDVVVRADGGGNVLAFRNPIVGIDRVLRMFASLHRKLTAQPARFIRPVWIDGLPGYVSRERDDVLQTTALTIEDDRVTGVYITRNPDKLGSVIGLLSRNGLP